MSTIQLDGHGAFVSWNPSDCKLEAARRAFGVAGFHDVKLAPRTEYEALREAMSVLKSKDQKLERHTSHERNGLEILQVERDSEVNGYSRKIGARVENGLVVTDIPLAYNEAPVVQARYEEAKQEVPSRCLSNVLVDLVLKTLSGQRMRERGGLYFIPYEALPRWYMLADALKLCAGSELFAAEITVNERSAEWIADSLTKQVMEDCEKLEQEISELETPEAIELRKTRAVELEAKVARYKGILGRNLSELEKATQAVQTAAMAAAWKAMGEMATV